jgi:CRISPR-associated protein Csd2
MTIKATEKSKVTAGTAPETGVAAGLLPLVKAIIKHRIDILFLFDAALGNPNGDPDNGNFPRTNIHDGRGLVSDVCIKAMIRRVLEQDGGKCFIQHECNLNRVMAELAEELKVPLDEASRTKEQARVVHEAVLKKFDDVRLFGAVMATGPNFGALTGPIQVTFASSIDPIQVLDEGITRSACAEDNDGKKKMTTADQYRAWEAKTPSNEKRTMGRKAIVRYGLYKGNAFVSGYRAAQSGLTEADLEQFLGALEYGFEQTRTSTKGLMGCRGIAVFRHVGTASDPAERARQALKGCAHSHKLFDLVKVGLRDGVEAPGSFADYKVTFNKGGVPAGVECRLICGDGWEVIG